MAVQLFVLTNVAFGKDTTADETRVSPRAYATVADFEMPW